jgi:hypothetical protein
MYASNMRGKVVADGGCRKHCGLGAEHAFFLKPPTSRYFRAYPCSSVNARQPFSLGFTSSLHVEPYIIANVMLRNHNVQARAVSNAVVPSAITPTWVAKGTACHQLDVARAIGDPPHLRTGRTPTKGRVMEEQVWQARQQSRKKRRSRYSLTGHAPSVVTE